MRNSRILLIAFLCISFSINLFSQSNGVYSGFLRQDGQRIVDGNGKNVLLRSMGLGGWMLQESYMMQTWEFANTQHEIKDKITELIGAEACQKYYDAWLKNHCTERDIDSLANWGFNAVRLPFHYNLFTLPIEQEPVAGKNTWLPKGFQMVDSLLKWCVKNKMYLILDMHGAPGGQGKEYGIADGDKDKPSFWDSEANRSKAIALWVKLAERYANEPWIGGYDLLNETNWQMNNNEPLKQYYLDLTAAIRQVDKKHILFFEGNWFANDFTNLTPTWDNNMAYSFHKYWNSNEQSAFQSVLDMRSKFNVPIWLGESGENSNQWFADCIAQMERNNIGWSWWPVKKIGSVVDPATITYTKGYHDLIDYWTGKGAKPSVEVATASLMELSEKLKIENCVINHDVLDAMFRQVNTNETKPYAKLLIPGRIYAMDFDMGKNGYAYNDTRSQNITGTANVEWNDGWLGRNDGVDLELDTDSAVYSKGTHVYHIDKAEWLKYTVNVEKAGFCDVSFRVSNGSNAYGMMHLEENGRQISTSLGVPPTGGTNVWKNVLLKNVKLEAGKQALVVYFDQGGFNLGSMSWTASASSSLPFSLFYAKTDPEGKTVYVDFSDELDPKSISLKGFDLTADGTPLKLTSVELVKGNPRQLAFHLEGLVLYNHTLLLTYSKGTIRNAKAAKLAAFSHQVVSNNIIRSYNIEGKLKASDFLVNKGLIFESCSDTDKGMDAGFTDAGDYLEFRVFVKNAGEYRVSYRYSALNADGSVELSLVDGTKQSLQTCKLPATGGWQTWKTVDAGKVTLSAGLHTLRLEVKTAGFNLNWLNFNY